MMNLFKIKQLFCLFVFTTICVNCLASDHTFQEQIDSVFLELSAELKVVKLTNKASMLLVRQKINEVKKTISQDLSKLSTMEKVQLLLEKEVISQELETLEKHEMIKINKIRYLKGLSILKMVYYKLQTLDHHYSTLSTLNEINQMSNPNSYQDFVPIKKMMKKIQKRVP